MEYTQEMAKRMIEMALKSSIGDILPEELERKAQILTDEDNLELLTHVINELEARRDIDQYLPHDKSFFVNETLSSFAKLKKGLSPVELDAVREVPIEDINLPPRMYNALTQKNKKNIFGSKKFKTLGDLLDISRQELFSLRNIGPKTLVDFDNAVQSYIYNFKG